MPENYQSASEMIRNLDRIRVPHEVVETHGPFRLVRFVSPFWEGSEYWLVNEKGFMWEPGDSIDALHEYLLSDEAREYLDSN